MVEYMCDDALSEILKAVSDPTRRSILTTLCQQGGSRVTDLADNYAMSLNAVSKHIKVLEQAGLVTRQTLGRAHWIEANLSQVDVVDSWLESLRSIWQLRLEKLNEVLSNGEENMADLTVNVVKTINAPIHKVFDAWLDPVMLSQFILPMPGMPHPDVQNDVREGGKFVITMQVGNDKVPHSGEYLTINRPNMLVFTWVSPFSMEGSQVTIRFNEVEGDKTHIELVHVRFVDEESRTNHEGGWGHILDSLNQLLS